MFKKISVVVLTNIAVLILSSSLIAEELAAPSNIPKASGVYIGVNAGYGKVNESVTNAPKNNNTGFAWSANAGYKLNPYFAAEAGFTKLNNEDFGTVSGGKIKGTENHNIYLAIKGMKSFENGFEVFGKIGPAWVHHKLSGNVTGEGTHDELAGYVGAGLGYTITQNLGVNLQLAATTKHNPVPAMWLGTAGLSYIF